MIRSDSCPNDSSPRSDPTTQDDGAGGSRQRAPVSPARPAATNATTSPPPAVADADAVAGPVVAPVALPPPLDVEQPVSADARTTAAAVTGRRTEHLVEAGSVGDMREG
jgi:hypothetical protein